ncbi:MAG: hypothetical protein KAH38_02300 [Candidatus Hydrogenedentes bacterium]|nr:hypothetical protein [Candidatus Hydrogenedentota bacterium]
MKKIIPQDYNTHRSYDWLHIAVTATMLPALIAAIILFIPVLSEWASLLLIKVLLVYYGVCSIILVIKLRRYPLILQDRMIRLEMQLRLSKLLSPDEQWQINGLDNDQLIALRFASDEELPELVHTVLNEQISNRNQIKRMIKQWTPDHDHI